MMRPCARCEIPLNPDNACKIMFSRDIMGRKINPVIFLVCPDCLDWAQGQIEIIPSGFISTVIPANEKP